jgi:cytochrome c oxidase subunit II
MGGLRPLAVALGIGFGTAVARTQENIEPVMQETASKASTWIRALVACATGIAGLAVAAPAPAVPGNLRAPMTNIAADVYGLHEYVMILVVLIFVGVFGAMFYSVYAHRKDKGRKAAQFHESTAIEIVWTAIPLVILVMLAWPATKVVIAQTDSAKTGEIIRTAEIKAPRN